MENWKLVPPDGGWGWIVLFGSTLVNILIPGTVKSFGVLFAVFIDVFGTSTTSAAWIPALCYFLYSSLGPLSSILSIKYSYRTVTLIGGTFAAVGMILSFFAQSVSYLYFSYGILVGTGAGLSFPPTVYIVTSYFVKLRGLANGICISGSAIGSIIVPPFLQIMLEVYGYRGAVLLMGAITLNVWVAALFYDPVEKHMRKVPNIGIAEEEKFLDCNKAKFIISTEDNCSPTKDTFLESNDSFNKTFIRSASSVTVPNSKGSRERKISAPMRQSELSSFSSLSGETPNQINVSFKLYAAESNKPVDANSQYIVIHSKKHGNVPRRSPSNSSFQYVSTPYHGSTLTLQPETFVSNFNLKAGSCVEKHIETKSHSQNKNKFFDISLLTDPLYLIILISNSTNAISYTNFIILLPMYALKLGYDSRSAALLLSIVSALDLVGRIGGSALSDLTVFPKYWYFISGLLLSGVSLSLISFTSSYAALGICCAMFGLASGVYVGITAVIMADMLGTERLQSSYGISLFVNGILQLIGPPLCGLWFESIKTYQPIVFWLGLVLVGGSMIWGFLPLVRKGTIPVEEI